MNRHLIGLGLLLVLWLGAPCGLAQEKEKPEAAPPSGEKKEEKKAPPPEEKVSQTHHSVRIGGQEIKYTATAATMLMKTEEGKPKATIFYVAYTRDDVSDPAQRPLTFAYNGGPGAASVWLHLGALGPMKVLLEDDGHAPPPPNKVVPNENSLLDVTDLVFIDPVSTGYSRAVPGEAPSQFHGLKQDVESVGEFIRLYATRNRRWASPKFLAGESYGTTRSAALSGYLQERFGMYLNGIILVSSVLNFQTLDFNEGNDLPPVLYLPAYTATAWYHKKLAPDLQADLAKALDQARAFAAGDYTRALAAGDALPEADRAKVVEQLARFTGLSPKYIEQTNLRVNILRFCKELLRDRRRTVGRIDSRFEGMDADAAGERFEYDPSIAGIEGAFSTAFNQYVRADLKFESDLPYEVLTARVRPWSFEPYENRYVNVAETLRSAMSQNPNLRVLVANGYYDLATPFFATEYTFRHLGLEPALRTHVSMRYYEAGHMIYIHKASLEQFKRDVAEFLRANVPQ